MKAIILGTFITILPLLVGGCQKQPVVDTAPIGNGLAVIGVSLVLSAWISAMFR